MEVKKLKDNTWIVYERDSAYLNTYIVSKLDAGWQCNCVDFFEEGNCEHIREMKKHLKLI